MFSRLSLLQKFSLICLAMLLVLGIVLNLAINHLMEKNLIQHAQEMTAAVVLDEVLHELNAADFRAPLRGEDYQRFSEKIKHLSLGPNIERIKIWSRDSVILWADKEEMVGLRYGDNHGVEDALLGLVVVELSWKGHEEQEAEGELDTEHHGKKLLELYVPISFAGSSEVDIIFEVYRNLGPLYVEFERQQTIVWCALISSFGLLFLALFTLVLRATRKIAAQRFDILESEMRYRNLIQTAQDGILAVSSTGRVLLSNPAAERIFNCSADDLSRRPLAGLLAESQQQPVGEVLQRLCANNTTTQSPQIHQWQGVRCSGERFPIALTFAVSGEQDNQLITVVLRDETERQMMQKKALDAEKMAGVSLIASSIGHEINNAISGLYCYAQMLKGKSHEPDFVSKCADTMFSQSEQLRLHATNLLSLGKPQTPRIGPLNLNDLLQNVTDLLRTSGLLKSFTLQLELAEKLPAIAGDPHLLEQLIRNLQINAAHAMGRKGTLSVRSGQSDAGLIYFEVEDTGTGIAAEKLEQIFEPFYTSKAEGEGTGLGLYIVRQVVEQHGGELQVDSQLDVGTRFRVLFPEPFSVMKTLFN
ncbi:MAG TPA: ATP-binding protein [Malonomonas sp.]